MPARCDGKKSLPTPCTPVKTNDKRIIVGIKSTLTKIIKCLLLANGPQNEERSDALYFNPITKKVKTYLIFRHILGGVANKCF